VRIGPFFDQGRLTNAKKRLRDGNIPYEIIRVTG
jgi:predicted RNA polymerase sigma factor